MPKPTALDLIVKDMLQLLNSTEHGHYNDLRSVRTAFSNLQEWREMSPDRALNHYGVDLKELIQSCISSAEEFRLKFRKDPTLDVALRDFQIPFNAYLDALNAGKPIEETLSDTSWTSGLFNEGGIDPPDPIAIPDKSREEVLKGDMAENLDTYKKIIKKAEENHLARMSKLTNGQTNPFETVSYRMKLMTMAATPFIPEKYEFMPPEHIEAKLNRQKFTFQIEVPWLSKGVPIFSDTFNKEGPNRNYSLDMERETIAHILNEKEISDDRQKSDVLSRMNAQLKNLYWTPENLGFDQEKLKQIRPYNILVNDITELLTVLQGNNAFLESAVNHSKPKKNAEDPDILYGPIEDKNNPLYKVYSIGENLRYWVSQYHCEMREDPPGETEMNAFISALTEYISNPDNYVYTFDHTDEWWQPSELPGTVMKGMQYLAEDFPEYRSRIEENLNRARNTLTEKISTAYSNLTDMGRLECQKYTALAKQLADDGIIPENYVLCFKAYDMMFVTNNEDNVLQRTVNAIKSAEKDDASFRFTLKEFLIAEHLKREIGPLRSDKKRSLEKFALITPGKDLYDLATDTASSAQLKEHIDKFLNCKGIKEILNAGFDDVKKLINLTEEKRSSILEKASIGEGDLLADVSNDTMKVFSYPARNTFKLAENKYFAVSNSDKYTNVNRALRNVNALRRNLEDTKPQDYTELFNALADYVNTRSPEPSSDSGKARFAAASEMLMKLGLQLRDKLPDMKADIDMKLKNTIIRSSRFREEFMRKCKDPALVDYAAAAALQYGYTDNDVTLGSRSKEEAFLKKNSNIQAVAAEGFKKNVNKGLTGNFKAALALKDETKRKAALIDTIVKMAVINQDPVQNNLGTSAELINRMRTAEVKNEWTALASDFVENVSVEGLKNMVKEKDFPRILQEGLKVFKSQQARSTSQQKSTGGNQPEQNGKGKGNKGLGLH